MVVVHPATRIAHTIELARRTTGAAVSVAVFAKARLRLPTLTPSSIKATVRAGASIVIQAVGSQETTRDKVRFRRKLWQLRAPMKRAPAEARAL